MKLNSYDFINSAAIRQHWEEICFTPSVVETAWLIWQSDHHNLAEKYNAWKEILSLPDAYSIHMHSDFNGDYTLHSLLESYLARTDILYHLANDGSAPACYSVHFSGELSQYKKNELYLTMGSAINAAKGILREALSDNIPVTDSTRIRIDKYHLDKPDNTESPIAPSVSIIFNSNMETMTLESPQYSENDDILSIFESMWFDFPVPFKKGDIVCLKNWDGEYSYCNGPLVLTGNTHNYCKGHPGYHGIDTSDMNVYGYFLSENGDIYHEVTWNLMDYEYYPAENLEDYGRQLIAMSSFLHGEIDEGLLVRACCKIRAEEFAKSVFTADYAEGLNYDCRQLFMVCSPYKKKYRRKRSI